MSVIGRVVGGLIGLCIAVLGGVVTWDVGYPVWFWIWAGLVAYMAIVAVSVSRSKPTNPWVDHRAGYVLVPWRMREKLRRRWDQEHQADS